MNYRKLQIEIRTTKKRSEKHKSPWSGKWLEIVSSFYILMGRYNHSLYI